MPAIFDDTPLQYGLHARCPGESLHPNLWDRLIFAFCPALMGPGGIYDLATPQLYHTLNNGANVSWRPSPHGRAWGGEQAVQSNNPTAYYAIVGAQTTPAKVKFDPPLSFACLCWWDGAQTIHLFNTDAYTTFPAIRVRGFTFLLDSASLVAYLLAGNALLNEALCPNVATNVTPPMSEWFSIVWTCTGQPIAAANTRCWINGVEDTPLTDNAGVVNAVHAAASTANVNGTGPAVGTGTGKVHIDTMLYYNRILSPDEAMQLSYDMLAPFRLADFNLKG